MMTSGCRPEESRLETFLRTDPVLAVIRDSAGALPVYLVGGAIRDALCGFPVDDIDLLVEGDPAPLISALDPAARTHERFGTAELEINGVPVDIARARTERYPEPGALPVVSFGPLADDLSRRDFTINSIAVAVNPVVTMKLVDPYGGLADLREGRLRVLHPGSFRDDPTRAIRGARYAARFGFSLAPDTADLVAAADFDTISADRLRSELLLLAGEEQAVAGFRLLAEWGLLAVDPTRLELATEAGKLLEGELWRGTADRAEVLLAACVDPLPAAIGRLADPPETPSEGVCRVKGMKGPDLVLARAAGARWLDRWRGEWSRVRLEITGADLLAAGVREGPAVGTGMQAALRARLDHGVRGREAQLEAAVAAAEGRS